MKTKEKMQLAILLSKETPELSSNQIIDDIGRLYRMAHRLRQAVSTSTSSNRYDEICDKADEIASTYGATVKRNGKDGSFDDIRGPALRLKLKSGTYNNLDGETWGIL